MTDNPPAFPSVWPVSAGTPLKGMTLRDWFAGQAITMCLKDMDLGYEAWAREAYAVADALLAQREEKP